MSKSDPSGLSPQSPQDEHREVKFKPASRDQMLEIEPKTNVESITVPLRQSLLTKQLSQSLHRFTPSYSSGRSQRYIDVAYRCLVTLDETSSYIALSYVWGHAELPQLTESNLEALSTEGVLTDDFLPKTIADALTVTKSLDEQYLWVDCLCIIQSHDAEKQDFIRNMHEIYARASVTIIAACGADASARRPGVTEGSRNLSTAPFDVLDVPLIVSLDPSPAKWWLGDTPWMHRGWTFQEKALSPRCLIFTEEQVYWECRRSLW